MKHTYSIAERNRIIEEHLPCIDKTNRRNHTLMRAAHLDRDDVYQQLAVRLIRAVDTFDPEKGDLEQHISAQLQYEMLNCREPKRLCGMTGLPKDFRKGEIISIHALKEDLETANVLLAA